MCVLDMHIHSTDCMQNMIGICHTKYIIPSPCVVQVSALELVKKLSSEDQSLTIPVGLKGKSHPWLLNGFGPN